MPTGYFTWEDLSSSKRSEIEMQIWELPTYRPQTEVLSGEEKVQERFIKEEEDTDGCLGGSVS